MGTAKFRFDLTSDEKQTRTHFGSIRDQGTLPFFQAFMYTWISVEMAILFWAGAVYGTKFEKRRLRNKPHIFSADAKAIDQALDIVEQSDSTPFIFSDSLSLLQALHTTSSLRIHLSVMSLDAFHIRWSSKE